MSLNLRIINPITYPSWNELLLETHDYSFFHSSHWAKVLHESYNYNPLYFSLIDGKRFSCLIPLMEIKSLLTGQRGVSLPFTDYCRPVSDESCNFHDAFNGLVQYGKKAGWKYIETRDGGDFFRELPVSSFYYGHTLNLLQDEKKISSGFKSSTKRNIKRAVREGVEVRVYNTLDSVKEFYRLNCITRKMHGLPPQPYFFFRKIFDHIISKNHGIIVLASHKERTVAGAVYFHFGNKSEYKYGASDKRYQHLRPNNLVMWTAIQWYCRRGYESLGFGRTDHDHKGLMQFKNGWGAEERIIKYYRFDLRKSAFINGNSHMSELHNKVFNKMPVPMLKIIGSVLYRHIG